MQRRQGRRVGMTEPHHWNAQPIAGLQRRVAGAVGIAGLDEVGSEGDEAVGPFLGRRRPAIAVAEGETRGGHGDEALAVVTVLVPWHHQGVLHSRSIARQPGSLGEEIAFHPARTRRIEHGGVDEMRAPRAGLGAGSIHAVCGARCSKPPPAGPFMRHSSTFTIPC